MTHMMVIVSAAVFDKARDAKGRRLSVGSVYPTAFYASSSRAIASNLRGDLYLVTVREGALWLVGVLRAPARKKVRATEGWAAAANTTPIVDISALVRRLEFESGTGINAAKLAMSLQTPRALRASDVALLEAAIGGARAEDPGAPTAAMAEAAVVAIAARLLGRDESDVRADTGRYAAFHEDDSFADQHHARIDWRTLTFARDEGDAEDVFGRSDFDLRRSLWSAECFEAPTDRSLRPLLARQEGQLYGEQVAALLAEGRLAVHDLADATVMARIRSGASLVEALAALLMLDRVEEHLLAPGEYAQVHRPLSQWVSSFPAPLRGAIGMFFQAPEAARCTGAWFEGEDRRAAVGFGGAYEVLLSWRLGEGQGRCHLVRVLDDAIAPVPAFTGLALLRKPAPRQWLKSGSSAEVTSVPLSTHLKSLPPKHPLRVMLAGDVDQAIAAQKRKKDPRLLQVITAIDPMIDRGEYVIPLAVVTACAPHARPKDLLVWEYLRAVALTELGCHREAFASAERGLALFREHGPIDIAASIDLGRLHNQIAWTAYLLGDFAHARDHAERAVAADRHNDGAAATLAVVLYACGLTKKAMRMIERAMRSGIDPCPNAALAADPAYRALAAKYRIPVALSDDEALALT